MQISVAMATYNGERFLREQLDSIASQALPAAELVVGDDGSSDQTVDIVTQFARTAPFPVRLSVNPSRLGYVENFFHVAERCRHPLIAYCDQDDVWMPDKLARCRAQFVDPDVVLVSHAAWVTDQSLRVTGAHWPDYRRKEVYGPAQSPPWQIPPGFTQVFRTSVLVSSSWRRRPLSHVAANTRMSHDCWTYIVAGSLGKVVFLPEVLALYRQHGRNLCGAGETGAVAAVRASRETGSAHYAWLSLAAGRCASWLEGEAAASDEPTAAAFRRASARYARASVAMGRRAALYAARGRPARLAHLIGMVGAGCYRKGAADGLSLRSLLKDVLVTCTSAPDGDRHAPR